MPNYKGKRPGTRRVVLWNKGHPREWVIEGSKRDGDDFEAKERLKLRAALPATARRVAPTFSELCREYGVHAEAHLKKSTWRVRRFQLASLVEFLGDKRLPELSPGLLDLYKTDRLGLKVRSSSVNNELRVLRAVLNWARKLGHEVPAFKVEMLKVRGKPRVRAFTAGELSRLWTSCRKESPTLLPILVFLVNTGCRKGEAIAAEWSWMDFDQLMIRIPSNEHWQPKNGLPREVPMGDAVRAVLSGPKEDPRWVFPSFFGGALAEFPKDLWLRASRAAGLTGGVHQLRHTFASHFLASGQDMMTLSRILGHSHGRITELYAHLLPGQLDRARNAVNFTPEIETVAPTVGRSKRAPKTA